MIQKYNFAALIAAVCLALVPHSAFAGGAQTVIEQQLPCECFTAGTPRTGTTTHYIASCDMDVNIDLQDDNSAVIGYLNDGRTEVLALCDDNMYNWLRNDFGLTACREPARNGAALCSRDGFEIANLTGGGNKCPDTRGHSVSIKAGDRIEIITSAGGDASFTACPTADPHNDNSGSSNNNDTNQCSDGVDNDGDGLTDFIDTNYVFNENGNVETPQLPGHINFAVWNDSRIPGWSTGDYVELQEASRLYGGAQNQVLEVDRVGHPYRVHFTVDESYASRSNQVVLQFASSARNKVPNRCYGVLQSFGVYVRRPNTSGPEKLGVESHYPSQNTDRPTFTTKTYRIPITGAGTYILSFTAESSCDPGMGSLLDDTFVYGSDSSCGGFNDNTENGGNGTTPECRDGIDNDGDGRTDEHDSDCTGPNDSTERPEEGTHDCNDGEDNDWDGRVDADDPNCKNGATDEYRRKQVFAELECIDKNYDAHGNFVTYTAHFTTFNSVGKTIGIKNDSFGGKRTNVFWKVSPNGERVRYNPPEVAAWGNIFRRIPKGRREGRHALTVDKDYTIEKWLGIAGEISAAIADKNTVECAPTRPHVCIDSANQRLHWGYNNQKHFKPLYQAVSGVNGFSPAPYWRDQGIRFKLGANTATSTDAEEGLTWGLSSFRATATSGDIQECN